MFCTFCGKKIRENSTPAEFCPFCGKPLTEHRVFSQETTPAPEGPPTVGKLQQAAAEHAHRPTKLLTALLATGGLLLFLVIVAHVGQQTPPQQVLPARPNVSQQAAPQQVVPARRTPLPFSRSDLLSTYNPPPQLITTQGEGTRHTIETYQCKLHQLEFEEEDGQLVRVAMTLDRGILSEDPDLLVVVFHIGVFVWKVGRITENLIAWMDQLGLNNAWSPSPSRIVVNGVEICRYVKGNLLILEAAAAGSAQARPGTNKTRIDSTSESAEATRQESPAETQRQRNCFSQTGTAGLEVWCYAESAKLSDPGYQAQLCQDLLEAAGGEALTAVQSDSSPDIVGGLLLFASDTNATARVPVITIKGSDMAWIRKLLRLGQDAKTIQSLIKLNAAIACKKVPETLHSRGVAGIDSLRSSTTANPTEEASSPRGTSEMQRSESLKAVSTYEAQLRSIVLSRGYEPVGKAWVIPADSKGNQLLIQQAACNNVLESHCQKLFIAFNDRFLGTDTFLPSWEVHNVAQEGIGSFSAVYEDLSDPNRRPPPVKVRYTWDGQKLAASGTPPTRPSAPAAGAHN